MPIILVNPLDPSGFDNTAWRIDDNDVSINMPVNINVLDDVDDALKFNSSIKTGILKITTTFNGEKISIDGDLSVFKDINVDGNLNLEGSLDINGDIDINGDTIISGETEMIKNLKIASISSALNINNTSGSQNNIVTTDISGYKFTNSGVSITGFANGINGKILYVHNVTGDNLFIRNNNSSSSAGNRILTGTGNDLIIKNNSAMSFQYDSESLIWRVFSNGIINAHNPITLDLLNTDTTINLASYSTTSFRIKNPAAITLSNGIDGEWYTLAIVSDGNYSFTSEVRFPLNNEQPIPSTNGRVDLYSLHCVNTTGGLRYLATFGYDYSDVSVI